MLAGFQHQNSIRAVPLPYQHTVKSAPKVGVWHGRYPGSSCRVAAFSVAAFSIQALAITTISTRNISCTATLEWDTARSLFEGLRPRPCIRQGPLHAAHRSEESRV